MDLFTMTPGFNPDTPVDEYISAIWTERYVDSGDVSLTVEASEANRALLAEGTFLGLAGSDEVMLLETQDIKDGTMKVSGFTLDRFFNNRIYIPADDLAQGTLAFTAAPGVIMGDIVEYCVVDTGWMDSNNPLQVDGPREVITDLYVRNVAGGTSQSVSVTRGPLFDEIKKIGSTYSVGWRLVPVSVTPTDYALAFDSYIGEDRTTAQVINPLVRFSPNLDSLADVSELRSKTGYRTVAYAITPDFDPMTLTLYPPSPYTGKAYAYPTAEFETDFARRTMLVEITGITAESVGDSIYTYQDVMDSHARNALANNNFTKVVDGEVVPQSEYQYGTHYTLGDLVELESVDGTLQTARITEYIRSKDKNGSREYPTVSVIE